MDVLPSFPLFLQFFINLPLFTIFTWDAYALNAISHFEVFIYVSTTTEAFLDQLLLY